MASEIDLRLKKLIVHILDTNLDMPILSSTEHPLDTDAIEFIEGHLMKLMSDDSLRFATFKEDNRVKELFEEILEKSENYVQYTSELAKMLYDIIIHYPDIPSGDLACAYFDVDGIPHLALLKFPYRNSYTHYVSLDENQEKTNSIIKQSTTLPTDGQKVDECIIVNLNDYTMRVGEKKYEINGEETYYLSNLFLDSISEMSSKEKLKQFKKAVETFGKKYLADNFDTLENFASSVNKCMDDGEVFDVDKIIKDTFQKAPELEKAFNEQLDKMGIDDREIELEKEASSKIFKSHKIKTDAGIEITLPYGFFRDKDKIEYINNPDGTISIMLKNINRVVNW